MLPGDRLICGLVEPQMAGGQFKTWPLHITIVPWFRLEETSERLAKGLERALQAIPPAVVTADAEVQFGPRKNRPARLLRPTGQLATIETKVRNYLHKKRAFLIDETTKKPYSFRPHVTMQHGFLLSQGARLCVDRLYIVEQKGDYKQVMSQITLQGSIVV